MSDWRTYYGQARTRAGRRQSPWNLLLIPLILGGIGTVFATLFLLVCFFQHAAVPDDAVLLSQTDGGEVLMHFPLWIASVVPGMMLANCVAWCIPPARRTLEAEAKGHAGTSFRAAMAGLLKPGVVILLFCLPLSFIGGRTGLSYVTDAGVTFGSNLHEWREVTSVKFWCCGNGGKDSRLSWVGYEIHLNSGESVNLLRNFTVKFPFGTMVLQGHLDPDSTFADMVAQTRQRRIEALKRIQPHLARQNGITYRWKHTPSAYKRLKQRYPGEPWVGELAALFEDNEARSEPVERSVNTDG